MKNISLLAGVALFYILSGVSLGRAVDAVPALPLAAPVTPPAAGVAPDVVPEVVPGVVPEVVKNALFSKSLFLTQREEAAIRQALQGVIGPDAAMLTAGENMPRPQVTGGVGPNGAPLPPPVYSVIRVYGVFYRAPDDWIVWINGRKVTPGALLPEIRGIEVEKSSHVHLKWYDQALNSIIAVTMRPHQTYDVQTGILLPTSK